MKNSANPSTGSFFQLDEFYLDLREDGRTISFLEKKEIEERPFPGLRPFKASEFQLFNGRDGQAEELIKRLKKHHFLSVIGSSGTGKSSLIRAGLIPQLLAGYLHGAGTNWDIAICRPGRDPVENLAVALARIRTRSNNKEQIRNELNSIEPPLSQSIYGILEINELLNPTDKPQKDKSNLLIIIDQFEELFRFKRDNLGKPDIENHFVNLLLKASLNPEVPVYVIITMRSEFLGDCAKYRGLPEAINEGQYLVPQLSRSQLQEVIEDPILLAGKTISPGLVELLVNEIEESKVKKDLDQLPILQHALMRTYNEAMRQTGTAEITYEHYIAAGSMENALANHAEKKYDELSDGKSKESFKQKIAKIIFQALTDASTEQKKGRRPTELKILCEIAASIKANEQQVYEVTNHFRDTETSFIMPPSNTPLYPELIMDISHESLMRQWSRLKDWAKEESENTIMLTILSSNQKRKEEGKKEYLAGKELKTMSAWYDTFNPQPAWAKRVSPDFEKSFTYLKESRQKHRNKTLLLGALIAGASILILFFTFYFIKGQSDKKAREEANLNLMFSLNKNAIQNDNKLQALFFTSEALLLSQDQNEIDSLLRDTKTKKLLPTYSLKNLFFASSDVKKASIGPTNETIFIWGKNVFSEINAETGKVIQSGKYKITKDDWLDPFINQMTLELTFESGRNPVTKDTVLTDSSQYFKREFINIFEKDNTGFISLPQKIKNIDGSSYSLDGTQILTWGQNTESKFDAVDIWDDEGNSESNSLIHKFISGAAFSNDNKFILTWGSDSTVRLWEKATIDINIIPKLFKEKIQLATGVEMSENDYTVTPIAPREFIKRRTGLKTKDEK